MFALYKHWTGFLSNYSNFRHGQFHGVDLLKLQLNLIDGYIGGDGLDGSKGEESPHEQFVTFLFLFLRRLRPEKELNNVRSPTCSRKEIIST